MNELEIALQAIEELTQRVADLETWQEWVQEDMRNKD